MTAEGRSAGSRGAARAGSSALLAAGVLAAGLCGCSDPTTQLIVVVDSDYRVPAELGFVRVAVRDGGDRERSSRGLQLVGGGDPELEGRVRIPFSVGVAPRAGDADSTVIVLVDGYDTEGGRLLVERRATTGFVEGETRLLRMFLARSCEDVWAGCTQSETCSEGGCVPAAVDPATLPEVEPGRELEGLPPHPPPRDAAMDAHEAGGRDGGPDARVTDTGAQDVGSTEDAARDAEGLDTGPADAAPMDARADGGDAAFDAGGRDTGADAAPDATTPDDSSTLDAGDAGEAGLACTDAGECDDSDPCTTDGCVAGRCVSMLRGCDDGNPCTTDRCDRTTGTCAATPLPDETACGSTSLRCCAGACVDTATNPTSCGRCGVSCGTGASCNAGACECFPGRRDCDSMPGCESVSTSDPANCGACGTRCMLPTPACISGTCSTCGSPADCPDDGLSCTSSPLCSGGACIYPVSAGSCLIAGTCYAAGDVNPLSSCQSCQPATTQALWSARTGATCDDRDFCTSGESCNASGTCSGGTRRSCDDSNACTIDSCSSALSMCTNAPIAPPANDSCSGATSITASGSYAGTVACAANDVTTSCGGGGSADVVYRLTLTQTSDVVLQLTAGFPALLELRSSVTCPGTLVQCDTTATGPRVSRTGLAAGTYHVIVAATGSATGSFSLAATVTAVTTPPPVNDLAAMATPITLSDATYTTVTGSTATATNDHTSTSCTCSGGADVWYQFSLSSRKIVFWHTMGTDFDVSVAIHSGSPTGAVPSGGCNDDSCVSRGGGNSYSSGAVVLPAGSYWVAVDGCGSGTFSLSMQTSPADADIGAPLASGNLTDTTTGRANDDTCGASLDVTHFAMSCPSDSFTLTASTCTLVTWDTTLEISLDGEPFATNTSCVDDTCMYQTTVTRDVAGAHLMRLLIDGFNTAAAGAYTVAVSGIP